MHLYQFRNHIAEEMSHQNTCKIDDSITKAHFKRINLSKIDCFTILLVVVDVHV